METLSKSTSRTYTVHVPKKDAAMFRWLCKGMKWEFKCIPQRKKHLVDTGTHSDLF